MEDVSMSISRAVVPRFIVGMPRTGTTWLCQSLNQHPDLAGFGETMFWGKSYIPPDKKGHYDSQSLQKTKASLLAKPFETTIAIPGPGGMKHVGLPELSRILEKTFEDLSNLGPGEVFQSFADAIARTEGKTQWVEKTPHHLLYAQR